MACCPVSDWELIYLQSKSLSRALTVNKPSQWFIRMLHRWKADKVSATTARVATAEKWVNALCMHYHTLTQRSVNYFPTSLSSWETEGLVLTSICFRKVMGSIWDRNSIVSSKDSKTILIFLILLACVSDLYCKSALQYKIKAAMTNIFSGVAQWRGSVNGDIGLAGQHFGLDWNISKTTGCIDINICKFMVPRDWILINFRSPDLEHHHETDLSFFSEMSQRVLDGFLLNLE